jgi:hypothetical protein
MGTNITPGVYKMNTLNIFGVLVYLIEQWYKKCSRFACTIFSPSDDTFSMKDEGY